MQHEHLEAKTASGKVVTEDVEIDVTNNLATLQIKEDGSPGTTVVQDYARVLFLYILAFHSYHRVPNCHFPCF